jgi:hypothetical protein
VPAIRRTRSLRETGDRLRCPLPVDDGLVWRDVVVAAAAPGEHGDKDGNSGDLDLVHGDSFDLSLARRINASSHSVPLRVTFAAISG